MLTNRQYKILKFISHHKELPKILKKYKINYIELQNILPVQSLYFSDAKFDDNTVVTLTNLAQTEVEEHRRMLIILFFTIITALSTAITAIATLKK